MARYFCCRCSSTFKNRSKVGQAIDFSKTEELIPDLFTSDNELNFTSLARVGYKALPGEMRKARDEFKRILWPDFQMDKEYAKHGMFDVLWRFDDPDVMNKWKILYDGQDIPGARSNASFVHDPNSKKGIFSGRIDTYVPRDGKFSRSGYAGIASRTLYKSFGRAKIRYKLDVYNCFVIRYRGDGRTYRVLFKFNTGMWKDFVKCRFTYPLFTTGGPYWQIAKIPFSKFFKINDGKITQVQERPMNEEHMNKSMENLAIAIHDDIDGDFRLEIDFIAAARDKGLRERFAYESFLDDVNRMNVAIGTVDT